MGSASGASQGLLDQVLGGGNQQSSAGPTGSNFAVTTPTAANIPLTQPTPQSQGLDPNNITDLAEGKQQLGTNT